MIGPASAWLLAPLVCLLLASGAAGQEAPEVGFLGRPSPAKFRQPMYNFQAPLVEDLRPVEAQLADRPARKPQTYGVIVDCGSSGTRAHIYHWATEIDFSLQMLHDIEPLRHPADGRPISRKITPGLAKLAPASKEQRVAYIRPLIEFIAANIPQSRHKYTAIYFMATAGMRLISAQRRESIMNDLLAFIESEYSFAKVDTSVISGADEGMYQWISINARRKRFLGTNTSARRKTFAVVEMGGASIQVTYQLRPGVSTATARALPKSLQPLFWAQVVEPAISRSDVLAHNYRLHSTTFLGLGVNSAREAYVDLLIRERRLVRPLVTRCKSAHDLSCATDSSEPAERAPKIQVYDDPCLPRNYQTPITEARRRPTRMLAHEAAAGASTIGFLAHDESEPTFRALLRGSANHEQCAKLVEKMLQVAKEESMHCSLGDTADFCTMGLLGERFVPCKQLSFMAISGFYHALTNSIIGLEEKYDHQRVLEQTRFICNMSHEQLGEHFKEANIKHEYLLSACFRAVFAQTFLTKGLRMPEKFGRLETKNQLGGEELDWTLGAILDKSLAIERATDLRVALQ